MKSSFRKAMIFVLIFSFIFTPFSFQINNLHIDKKTQAANLEDINIGDIDSDIVIDKDEEFIVEAGGEILFTQNFITVDVYGKLEIKGTKDNPVKIQTTGKNFSIITHPGSEVIMENVEIEKGGYQSFLMNNFFNSAMAANYMGAIHFEGGNANIKGVTFRNGSYAVTSKNNSPGELKVNYSKFINNEYDVEDENESDFTNNYWDDLKDTAACKTNQNVSSCLSNSWGNFKIYPWQTDPNFSYEIGASNVLFLPGIKASHLYKYDDDGDLDELWVPNWFGGDIDELGLDEDGISNEKVFTKEGDVLEDTIMGNLYESFLGDLGEMKDADEINDYNAFAYDWRQSVEDIAKNGTPYEGQTKSVVDKIVSLAQSSKSGKVTIVAHSNGGLVAKAAMIELEKQNLVDRVDKIILVGTPQMGTPLSILSFLYGYEESLPSLLSQEEARKLIENMPGAYGLLPSKTYLDRLIEDKIIDFPVGDSERGKMFKDAYGDDIDSFDEFRDFLLANVDNREKPESKIVSQENILNEKLLDEAILAHNNLDNWKVPASVKLIQLAGWGLPTVSGIDYIEKKETECKHSLGSSLPVCYDGKDYVLVPEPKFTVDGDAIVTTPSGLMMSEGDNVERYWFDLSLYSKENEKRKHGNIFEANSIREFAKDIIISKNSDLPKYISESRPEDYENAKPKIRMSLYSPLDIHLYSGSNHTGPKEIAVDGGVKKMIEENIPNSYYFQLGERKYIGFNEDEDTEITLDGYDSEEEGYTLKIEEVKYTETGEEVLNYMTFKNLPTSEKTQIKLTIPASGLKDISDLEADYDGDGINDYVLESALNEEITITDKVPPVIEVYSPESKIYLKDRIIEINYGVFDNESAEGEIEKKLSLDDKSIVENRIDLSLLQIGEHRLTIEAMDKSGNKSKKEVVFNVITNINTLSKNINHFYDLKLIKTAQEKKMLLNNLEIIKRQLEFYDSIKNNVFIKNKNKTMLLNIIEENIQRHIDIIVWKIEHDKYNYDIMIKSLLADDFNFIKNNIK